MTTIVRLNEKLIHRLEHRIGTPSQHITLTGRLANTTRSITALCGPVPPTQTDGWAMWNTLARPRQVGMTINSGYNPFGLDVQLRFEAWSADYMDTVNGTPNHSAQHVEDSLRSLVWMTGRGSLYAQNGAVANAAVGDPPVVSVFSVDSTGQQTPLVPLDFQNLSWVISKLAWDTGPLRNSRGFRTRQDVTVSLLQYVPDEFQDTTTAGRARQAAGQSGQYRQVTTTQSMNTIQQVATQVANDATAAGAILQANKDVPGIGTSTRKPLPPGTRVRVPVPAIKFPPPTTGSTPLQPGTVF